MRFITCGEERSAVDDGKVKHACVRIVKNKRCELVRRVCGSESLHESWNRAPMLLHVRGHMACQEWAGRVVAHEAALKCTGLVGWCPWASLPAGVHVACQEGAGNERRPDSRWYSAPGRLLCSEVQGQNANHARDVGLELGECAHV